MTAAVISLTILAIVLGAFLLYAQAERDKARVSAFEFSKLIADAQRKEALWSERAVFEQERAKEWKQQAIAMSRRNHELTEILAQSKKQELLVDPDTPIPDPPSVFAADADTVRNRRPVATADRDVRPPATAPIANNNDDEDDGN